jgi:hypothetical protein
MLEFMGKGHVERAASHDTRICVHEDHVRMITMRIQESRKGMHGLKVSRAIAPRSRISVNYIQKKNDNFPIAVYIAGGAEAGGNQTEYVIVKFIGNGLRFGKSYAPLLIFCDVDIAICAACQQIRRDRVKRIVRCCLRPKLSGGEGHRVFLKHLPAAYEQAAKTDGKEKRRGMFLHLREYTSFSLK